MSLGLTVPSGSGVAAGCNPGCGAPLYHRSCGMQACHRQRTGVPVGRDGGGLIWLGSTCSSWAGYIA